MFPQLLGSTTAHRLAIFSFNIVSHGRYLHHDFVVSLLEHIFGIQARGGCSCAGRRRFHALFRCRGEGSLPGVIHRADCCTLQVHMASICWA